MMLFVRYKIHISIFSKGQLKVVAIILGLFALNLLWTKTLTPLFMMLPCKELIAAIIEGAIRTSLLVGIGVALTYYWNVSAEVNNLILKAAGTLRKNR